MILMLLAAPGIELLSPKRIVPDDYDVIRDGETVRRVYRICSIELCRWTQDCRSRPAASPIALRRRRRRFGRRETDAGSRW
jgi:hypothetical protein